MKYFLIICGILLLIGGFPLVFHFAAGTARILFSILLVIIAISIILWGISLLRAAV